MISETIISKIFLELKQNGLNGDYFSKTRDVFSARLENFIKTKKKYLESAIIGEIGNNSFDHNFQTTINLERGVYFNPDFENNFILLADFGQGVRNSLLNIKKEINSDLEALKIAFTERVSGRYPEQRGNGLKFVLTSIQENKWNLFFQSGNACCTIDSDSVDFFNSIDYYHGCVALIKF